VAPNASDSFCGVDTGDSAQSNGQLRRLKNGRRKKVLIEHAAGTRKALIVGVKSCVYAVPLKHVIETMRPLPVERISGVPSFVRGLSIIRGIPTPVVDLGAILDTPGESGERFVTLRVGDKQIALSVNEVLGVRDLDAILTVREMPPLLQRASQEVVETIGTLDQQVLMVLRAGWELPKEVWHALTTQEAVL
jgi:purine-binding chemotaxis protein CheW